MTPKAQPRQWYRFQNSSSDPAVAELNIFDDIGKSFWNDDAVSAKQFFEDLKALPQAVAKIIVHVNSLGGDVFDAVAIANGLRDQRNTKGRTIEMVVDGIAASAATIVIMAGDTIKIADNGLIFVHLPWTIEIGNAVQMRKTADALDTIRNTIVATYKWHSQLSDEELIALMDAETWFEADSAITNGFATEKVEGLKAAASIDPRALSTITVPEKYKARVQALVQPADPRESTAPKAAVATEVLRLCREGACLDLAEPLIAEQATLEQVQARITERGAQKAAEAARASTITAACASVKMPQLAANYIAGGISVEHAKATLVILSADRDRRNEIDNSLDVDRGTTSRRRVSASPNAMYLEPKKLKE